jgi:hypothetical protein
MKLRHSLSIEAACPLAGIGVGHEARQVIDPDIAIDAIKVRAPKATMLFDQFHIVRQISEAVDKVLSGDRILPRRSRGRRVSWRAPDTSGSRTHGI